jgi:hypothetical protein
MVRFLILLLLLPVGLLAQSNTDPELQAAAAKAKHWMQQETKQWDVLRQQGHDPVFAKAIVYPELLRYSQFRDQLETIALQVLYIQLGSAYADFSIGPFQMKPSFASRLDDWQDTEPDREKRIAALTTIAGQFDYLLRFLSAMDKRFAGKRWVSTEEKLRFYAAAYNAGFHHSYAGIADMAGRQQFRLTEWSRNRYRYTDLAVAFYKQELPSGN